MTNLRYKIQKAIFKFLGDIRWHGITHPFWITINAKTFQIKGHHCREVEELAQPGDILIRRFEGYLDKFLIPGWFNHAGLYTGEYQVVHAISDGVVVEDLLDFMRTDHIVVLRPPNHLKTQAISKAIKAVGNEYDFNFDFNNTVRFSCTELIGYCYSDLIKPIKRFGRATIIADDIVKNPNLQIVWCSPNGIVRAHKLRKGVSINERK